MANKVISQSKNDTRIQQLENSIASRDSIIFHVKMKSTEKIGLLNLSLSDKDSIIRIQKDNLEDNSIILAEKDEIIRDLQEELKQFELDEFLNVREASIFNTNFQSFDTNFINPRNLDYYLLIENIHSLDSILDSVSQNVSSLILLNNELENLTPSTANRLTSLSSLVKSDLELVRERINSINLYATDEKRRVAHFLSDEQYEHYVSLVNRYKDLYDLVYPQ